MEYNQLTIISITALVTFILTYHWNIALLNKQIDHHKILHKINLLFLLHGEFTALLQVIEQYYDHEKQLLAQINISDKYNSIYNQLGYLRNQDLIIKTTATFTEINFFILTLKSLEEIKLQYGLESENYKKLLSIINDKQKTDIINMLKELKDLLHEETLIMQTYQRKVRKVWKSWIFY